MDVSAWLWVTTTTLFSLWGTPVSGHGRLIEPPSRASAWRYGFSTPANYNDHELYCGGFTRQWQRNGGKCGICGDAWDATPPRAHEHGGRYGQGVIVRRYAEAAVIAVRVQVTANHNGYFEFRLCPEFTNNTQACFDEHVLRLARPQRQDVEPASAVRYYPNDGNRIYDMEYRLPHMSCDHCVLQWRYIAGNNWGSCADNTSRVGCGPQEEFRACADIQIGNMTAATSASPPPRVPFRRPGFSRPPYVPPRPTTARAPVNASTTNTTTTTTTPSDPLAVPKEDGESGAAWVALLIALISFVIVTVTMLLLYFYYYHQRGSTWTSWLKKKAVHRSKQAQAPPVKPPRTKHLQRQSSSTLGASDLQSESVA